MVKHELHDVTISPRPTNQEGDPELSLDEQFFWGGKQPKEIVFATGSTRKAYMTLRQMYGLLFAGDKKIRSLPEDKDELQAGKSDKPLDLQSYFNLHIFNGNGALKGKVLLGYLRGVPVYAEATYGETASNVDPVQEAKNKTDWLYENKYKGQNVLLISTDTVDSPNTAEEPLGKPMNEIDFPKLVRFMSVKDANQAAIKFLTMVVKIPQERMTEQLMLDVEAAFPRLDGFDASELEQAQQAYLRLYTEAYYAPGTVITHQNGVVILDALSGNVLNPDQQLAVLSLTIDEIAPGIVAVPDSGGGALLQQNLQPWDRRSMRRITREMGDSLTRDAFADIKDSNALMWALYCQIAGAPWKVMEKLLLETIGNRSVVEQSEVVRKVKHQVSPRNAPIPKKEAVVYA